MFHERLDMAVRRNHMSAQVEDNQQNPNHAIMTFPAYLKTSLFLTVVWTVLDPGDLFAMCSCK